MADLIPRIREFWNDVRTEIRKVTWPDRKELNGATRVVLLFVFISAIIVMIVDVLAQGLVRGIFRAFT